MRTTSATSKLCKCPGVDQGTLLIHRCFKPSALPNRLQDRLLMGKSRTHPHTKDHCGHLEQNLYLKMKIPNPDVNPWREKSLYQFHLKGARI